jgi:hypothetical protein
MATQLFSAASLLTALPPSLAAATVINWALPQAPKAERRPDEEEGQGQPLEPDNHVASEPTRPSRQASGADASEQGVIDSLGNPSRRNSTNHRDDLPDPRFRISDDDDPESLNHPTQE